MGDEYDNDDGQVPDAVAPNEKTDEEYKAEVVAREKEVQKLLSSYEFLYVILSYHFQFTYILRK